MDIGQCKTPEDEVPPQALAFTVTFGSAKTTNKFIKRHSRNFSLPVVKVYENQVSIFYVYYHWLSLKVYWYLP